MPRAYEVQAAQRRYPLPWTIEEDWLYEVKSADGSVVCSTPYRRIADAIVYRAEDFHELTQ